MPCSRLIQIAELIFPNNYLKLVQIADIKADLLKRATGGGLYSRAVAHLDPQKPTDPRVVVKLCTTSLFAKFLTLLAKWLLSFSDTQLKRPNYSSEDFSFHHGISASWKFRD